MNSRVPPFFTQSLSDIKRTEMYFMRCRFLHKEAIFDFQMMFHIFSSFSSIQILKRNMGVWISYFTKIHTSSIWTESVNYTKKMWYLRELCIVSALKLSILLHVVQVDIGMFDAPYFVHPLLLVLHWRRKAFYSSISRGDNHEGSCLIFVRLFSAEQFDKLFVIYEAVFVNVGGSHKLFGF